MYFLSNCCKLNIMRWDSRDTILCIYTILMFLLMYGQMEIIFESIILRTIDIQNSIWIIRHSVILMKTLYVVYLCYVQFQVCHWELFKLHVDSTS